MIRNLIPVQDSCSWLVEMADGATRIVSALQRLAGDASKRLACGGADNRIASYLLVCGAAAEARPCSLACAVLRRVCGRWWWDSLTTLDHSAVLRLKHESALRPAPSHGLAVQSRCGRW